MKAKAEHCVLQGEHMRCIHCGAMERINTPTLLKQMGKQIKNFIGRHDKCEVPVSQVNRQPKSGTWQQDW